MSTFIIGNIYVHPVKGPKCLLRLTQLALLEKDSLKRKHSCCSLTFNLLQQGSSHTYTVVVPVLKTSLCLCVTPSCCFFIPIHSLFHLWNNFVVPCKIQATEFSKGIQGGFRVGIQHIRSVFFLKTSTRELTNTHGKQFPYKAGLK